MDLLKREAETQIRTCSGMVAVIVARHFGLMPSDAAHPAPGGAQVHADSLVQPTKEGTA
jgi:hypothetical protein